MALALRRLFGSTARQHHRPNVDLRDRLSHVLWIGGAPCVGKTTLARVLAGKFDLKIYNLDWHHVREHRTRPGGVPASWESLTMDERWVLPAAGEMAEREVANWTARFPLVVEDLLGLPVTRTIVAEGPSAFPWSVAPVIRSPRQAVFLVPTGEWRDAVRERRERDFDPGTRFGDGTRDPVRARRNLRERDVLLGARIERSCAELGLHSVRVDGSLDVADSLALIEAHFRPHLPAGLNV